MLCKELTVKGVRCHKYAAGVNGNCDFHSKPLGKAIKTDGSQCKWRVEECDYCAFHLAPICQGIKYDGNPCQ